MNHKNGYASEGELKAAGGRSSTERTPQGETASQTARSKLLVS